MNRYLLSLVICGLFISSSHSAFAETEPYYATGEDIDNLIAGDDASVLIEIEQKLSEFSIYRQLEKYFFNTSYFDNSEEADIQFINDLE